VDEQQITVAELAERCGLAVSAVRYYERAGLLPPPWRHRRTVRYPASAIERINSVRHAQAAGLSLAEIRELTVLGERLQLRQ
jgi:MerR family copper efflux transcriptional regulator